MIKKKDRRKEVMIIIFVAAILIIIIAAIFLFNTTNEYTMKYKKVIDDFVTNYYPELSGRKIIVAEMRLSGKDSAIAPPIPFFSLIGVSRKVRGYSEDSVKGLLAHELAHIDNNRNKSIFYFVGWLFSKKVKADYEREADQKVIDVGLGGYLLASAEAEKNIYTPEELAKRYTVNGYLSPGEIIQELATRKAS